MNVLIFDHLARVISLQASPEWLRDFFYHPDALSEDKKVIQNYIEKSLASYRSNSDYFYQNSQMIAPLSDKSLLGAIPISHTSGLRDGLAIVDFPNHTFLHRSYFDRFGIDEKTVSQLNPDLSIERERLEVIQKLIQKKLIHLDPKITEHLTPSEARLLFKEFKDRVIYQLSQGYDDSKNITTLYNPAITPPFLSIAPHTSQWCLLHFGRSDSFQAFVSKALDLLINHKFILTEQQEQAWHSHRLLDHVFQPLRIAREKEALNEDILKPSFHLSKNYKI